MKQMTKQASYHLPLEAVAAYFEAVAANAEAAGLTLGFVRCRWPGDDWCCGIRGRAGGSMCVRDFAGTVPACYRFAKASQVSCRRCEELGKLIDRLNFNGSQTMERGTLVSHLSCWLTASCRTSDLTQRSYPLCGETACLCTRRAYQRGCPSPCSVRIVSLSHWENYRKCKSGVHVVVSIFLWCGQRQVLSTGFQLSCALSQICEGSGKTGSEPDGCEEPHISCSNVVKAVSIS